MSIEYGPTYKQHHFFALNKQSYYFECEGGMGEGGKKGFVLTGGQHTFSFFYLVGEKGSDCFDCSYCVQLGLFLLTPQHSTKQSLDLTHERKCHPHF